MIAVRAWVRALAHRRRRIVARRPGASMVVAFRLAGRRVPRGPGVVHHHHRHDHRHLHTDAPPIAAAVVGPVRSASGPRAAGPQTIRSTVAHITGRRIVTADPPATQAVAVITAPPVVRAAHAAGVRCAAAGIRASHRRIETFAPPRLRAAPVSPDRPVSAPLAPPPPPAIGRSAPAIARRPAMVVRPLAPPATQAAPAEVPGHALSAPRAAAAAAAPELDIEQLTERVVRQIDRRIVAHRERLGQV